MILINVKFVNKDIYYKMGFVLKIYINKYQIVLFNNKIYVYNVQINIFCKIINVFKLLMGLKIVKIINILMI